MPEFRRATCSFCRQTFVTATLESCSLCGRSGGLAEFHSDSSTDEAQGADYRERVADQIDLGRLRRAEDSEPAEPPGTLNKQIVLGVFMMLGAVAWFALGWAGGRVYFYPPILFVLGIVSLARGLSNRGQ